MWLVCIASRHGVQPDVIACMDGRESAEEVFRLEVKRRRKAEDSSVVYLAECVRSATGTEQGLFDEV